MNMIKTNEFIFSSKYRVLRHISFWLLWLLGWTCFLTLIWSTFIGNFIRIGLWIPVFITFSYPVSYIAIPKLLLKDKYLVFLGSIIIWLAVGWFLSVYYLKYISAPLLDRMNMPRGDGYEWQ